MSNQPLNKRILYKQYVQAPILRPFWRKDKNAEAVGIYADFTHKTSHMPLETSKDCFIFSWAISEHIMVPLQKMLDEATTNQDKSGAKKVLGTMNWLRKKAFKHSAEVRNEMKAMSEHPEFIKSANEAKLLKIIDETSEIMETMSENPLLIKQGLELGLSVANVKETMLKIAALHDIGRLAEIDLQSGTKFNGPDMLAHEIEGMRTDIKGVDHAITSYEVAKANGVNDPLILLPIKYHSVRDLESEIVNDTEFQALSATKKDQVLLFGHAIRDADKIANLISYTKTGVKLCGEMTNPDFHGDCDISAPVLEDFYNRKTVNVKETKTYLDAMFKFASWTYDLHFDFNKERAGKTILAPLFERMKEENRDELSNAIKSLRKDWRAYEELSQADKDGTLTPELSEKLEASKEPYKTREQRPNVINVLRFKAIRALHIINNAQSYITDIMNKRDPYHARRSNKPAPNKKNTFDIDLRLYVPRVSNTSALFELKRKEGKVK